MRKTDKKNGLRQAVNKEKGMSAGLGVDFNDLAPAVHPVGGIDAMGAMKCAVHGIGGQLRRDKSGCTAALA